MAMTDGLTGLSNRRAFDAELERQWSRVLAESSQFSLVLLDIDHFKKFNDEYGHLAGDDCLRVVGAAVKSAVRDGDVVARYGGEEIAIILPSTDSQEAVIVAEAVRNAIENLGIEHGGNPEGGSKVTASFGVATALARAGGAIRMPESLLLSADKALYMAKSEGRNCVRKVMMMAAPQKPSEA
ncbi:GGDEF domain-containing protein [Terriglobus roseus]|uniref:GGDEF domain-containing protein n=1 Tax=Terriglobus roseus TaxID=392734 RepID=UPI0009F4442E|nr:GGDEF domain-containing protein [Terriglobus roseus]